MPKVIQLFNDKPFAIYGSIGSAARKTGIKYNYIQDAIHGRRGGCRGFKFRFATDEEEKQYGNFHVVRYLTKSLPKEEVIRGLRIEQSCVSRNCNRDCASCDLVQEKDWLLMVYEGAIRRLENSK